MARKLRPNEPCHCGSGRKYKKCCARRDALPEDERDLPDPGPVSQQMKDAAERMLAEEGYTAEKARALLVLERVKRRASVISRSRTLSALTTLHSFASST